MSDIDRVVDLICIWICKLAMGLMGDMIDLSGLYTELSQPPQKELLVVKPPKRFEAYTDCPKCGQLDYHLLRAPKPPPADIEMQHWRDRQATAEVQTWGSYSTRTIDTSPPPPVDESQFEVIRICKCGNEWGQV